MTISKKAWDNYLAIMKRIDAKAYKLMKDFVETNGLEAKPLIRAAYEIATTYGESSAAVAAEMFEAISDLAGHPVTAEMAETASYSKVAQTVNGVMKQSQNADTIAASVSRLVKLAGENTMLNNARKYKAQIAWIPRGDTCAYCIALASRGWQTATGTGDAEHIHGNCDCHYAIRYDETSTVSGYDPKDYLRIYRDAPGHTSKDKLNSMRRDFYAENKDKINEQKRSAYAKRKELNSSQAEEADIV